MQIKMNEVQFRLFEIVCVEFVKMCLTSVSVVTPRANVINHSV